MLRTTGLWLVLVLGALGAATHAHAEEGAGGHDEGHGHGEISFKKIVTLDHATDADGNEIPDHDTYSFYAAILNFGLLLLVLHKLGRQPLLAFLTKRRDELEQGIKEASDAKAKAEAKYREYAERLERLDDELAKLKSDIAAAANAERERILSEAQASAARADADTRTLIELQAKQLGANVRRELVAAAVESAQQVLGRAIAADDHKRIADGYAKSMGEIQREKRA